MFKQVQLESIFRKIKLEPKSLHLFTLKILLLILIILKKTTGVTIPALSNF